MCHHYDSEKLAHWELESTTEEDEPSEEPELDDERGDREPATPPADD